MIHCVALAVVLTVSIIVMKFDSESRPVFTVRKWSHRLNVMTGHVITAKRRRHYLVASMLLQRAVAHDVAGFDKPKGFGARYKR